MKKISSLLLALIACAGTMFADEVQIGDLYYNLNANNKTAEVTSMPSSAKYTGGIIIPASVDYNSVTYSVTSIGIYAFYGCTSLTSITIGNSVTSIGRDAFWGCIGLTSITIPNSVTSIGMDAFYGCSGLTSITIPNSVTSIENEAFYGCTSLTSVTIGNSVTSIGDFAFALCYGLTSMVVASGNTKYDSRENCNAIIETSSNTLIAGCQNTIIPNSVTSIGAYAFAECSGLTSVTIPNSVTSIGESAFGGCSGLTSITIPNSVTSIGEAAFWGCSGLTSITIPNSVKNIGEGAFVECTGLTSIVVASGNTNYDSRENCNAIIETASNTLIRGCQNTIIPNSVTSIGRDAFSACYGLTSVTIPNSVTSIGDDAFWNCSGLTSVTNYAATPQTINSNVFYNVNKSSCTLYVPEGSINLYKAANVWKDFINIQAIDETQTSIDQITNNQTPVANKIIKDGQVVILRGDKTYTVTGQQLK